MNETVVREAARAQAADDEPVVDTGAVEVGDQGFAILVQDLGADGHLQMYVFALAAVHLTHHGHAVLHELHVFLHQLRPLSEQVAASIGGWSVRHRVVAGT